MSKIYKNPVTGSVYAVRKTTAGKHAVFTLMENEVWAECCGLFRRSTKKLTQELLDRLAKDRGWVEVVE